MVMIQFQQHMDLNDALDRWKEKESLQKTWLSFKTFFGKEIKKNRNRKGTFKEIGLANAVTQQQVETNRENQQILTANSIKQKQCYRITYGTGSSINNSRNLTTSTNTNTSPS
jgi:hypothetical protein